MNKALIIASLALLAAYVVDATSKVHIPKTPEKKLHWEQKCSEDIDQEEQDCSKNSTVLLLPDDYADIFMRKVTRKVRIMYA